MNTRFYIFAVLFLFNVTSLDLYATTAANTNAAPVDNVPSRDQADVETGESWDKDIDKKIDTTINVLKVLKEELKDVKKEEAKDLNEKTAKSRDEMQGIRDLSASVRKAMDRAKKIMVKLKKTAGEDGDVNVSGDEASKDIDTLKKDLSGKLDKTIEAMKIMKEELDKGDEK